MTNTAHGASPADIAATFCATLVDEWVRAGVRHAVVAPGSRSTPMALALASRPELRVDVFHDERSAAFAALGIGLASGTPALLLCTSGTAAANFHPAVIEADLAGVPLLVLTADRPPELRDVSAPQTINQTHLYGDVTRWFHDPGVPDEGGRVSWRRLARRAFAATGGANPGPVHVNLPFREPLLGVPGHLPPVVESGAVHGVIVLDDTVVDDLAALLDAPRGVIIAGAGCGDPAAVGALAEAAGWPIIADPRSGCGGLPNAVTTADALLRHAGFARDHAPQGVLRLGAPPASKVLAEWVRTSGAVVAQVTSRPIVIDPDGAVSRHVVADPSALCRALAKRVTGAAATPWFARWRHADERANVAIDSYVNGEAQLSEPAVARVLGRVVEQGSALVVSSSMPVRDLEWFGDVRGDVRVMSNRGANGIDGVVSTAVGVALATGAPVTLLIGDVALVHDSNGLAALAGRGVDVRVVVVDNDGGGIFSFLPQASQVPHERFELLFGTPHAVDVVLLCAAFGIEGRTISTAGELRSALAQRGPWLVRVPTDRVANVEVHRALNVAVATALDSRP